MAGVEDRIRAGGLARAGVLSEEDIVRAAETVALVEAEGIETVRVLLADPHGILRGKTITAEALTDAFASGIRAPSTLLLKDVSHRTVFPVWSEGGDAPMLGAGDLVLAPLPHTFRVLPWSPHSAFIHCDVSMTSGEPVSFASRRSCRAPATGSLNRACGRSWDWRWNFRSSRSPIPRSTTRTPPCRPVLR